MEVEQELKDYRFRTIIRSGNKRDHAKSIDAREIVLKNNISKVNRKYKLDLEHISLNLERI
ncbi:hypothetical protein Asulf_00898 [Archaeoglobus sulfaticallidus PM70-1]|uniref:Uncharacterized protein n=1 Tax=Archaeoglobus sulfaticallidus PM70-1 TaxID=387631 RepID=N0BL18_9EURY|nr:hypothetical protein [Archaeoglobus sulfaticallidus]AGK60905.1 hypothetical protein Asulf_00898 [Archaeoglobus sulfaticallidus PM70-1]